MSTCQNPNSAMPPDPQEDPRQRLPGVRRIVVKIGTNVLCRESGEIALGRVYSLLEEMVDLHRRGREVILVSSGSIALGMDRLRIQERPATLVDKQACAAIGQIRLMSVYQQALDRLGIATAQVLLTDGDFSSRGRYLNLRNTLSRLLEFRVFPIVNENDTVSTSEIETHLGDRDSPAVFGDNDVLSALVASKLGADLLIILSNTDGLHTAPPDENPGAPRVSVVPAITPAIEVLAGGGSRRGRGGMRTKLHAAKVATRSGTLVVIARGAEPGILSAVLAGNDVGTIFLPGKPLSSRKRWIAFATSVAGSVRVNDGAREALVRNRASLLFAGVSALERDFESGDIVSILDEGNQEFARGIANYSSDDARDLIGRRSGDMPVLAENGPEEFIHRDNIVILRE